MEQGTKETINFISYDLERPNFKVVQSELTKIVSELLQSGNNEVADKIIQVQNMIDSETRKNESFKRILNALSNVADLNS